MVDGDHHGGGGLGVQVVGREVLGSSANASPRRCRQSNDQSGVALPEPGSRMRRGAVMVSRILARIAAASAGTVKCPVLVPSPLSCIVNEHLAWAACSSVRTCSFSWASTTLWSGSTASIARRATAAELVGAPGGLLHQVGYERYGGSGQSRQRQRRRAAPPKSERSQHCKSNSPDSSVGRQAFSRRDRS